MDEDTERIKVVCGLELAQPPLVGVYHYRQTGCDSATHNSTCSVIANHSSRVSLLFCSKQPSYLFIFYHRVILPS